MQAENRDISRHLWFGLSALLIGGIFYTPLKEIITLARHSEFYSHVIVVPFVTGYFLFLKRNRIASEMKYSFGAGIALLAGGTLLYFVGKHWGILLSRNDYLSVMMFSAWVFWTGAFILCYGIRAFKVASFPMFFLLFLIPIPDGLRETWITFLQGWSAEAVNVFLKVTGVPFLRDGVTFQLSAMSFEVARQCAGIRSSIALFIVTLFGGQLFLRTGWKRLVLVLAVVPVTVLKNGLRIVTLVTLGNYVDQRILQGDLHRSGGIPFLVVALGFLAPILWVLRKSEKRTEG